MEIAASTKSCGFSKTSIALFVSYECSSKQHRQNRDISVCWITLKNYT